MLFIGADHAGFEMKTQILKALREKGVEVEDCGTGTSESCDYPQFAEAVCHKVKAKAGSLGLLICGSGIGMSIAANKVAGIRAAAVSETKSAALARQHNNAQVLCLGARIISVETALQCLDAFLSAEFDTQNPRHQRRIDLISKLEGKS